MNEEIISYNAAQEKIPGRICDALLSEITRTLPQARAKLYHGNPVWFIEDNPVTGYSVTVKGTVNLLFWSGQSFEEPDLNPVGEHKAAEAVFRVPEEIDTTALARWLQKSADIQWDYKNIRKSQGNLQLLP